MPGLFRVIRAGQRGRNRIDPRHVSVIGDAVCGLDWRQPWETREIIRVRHALLDMIDVVGGEAAAPLVKGEAESAPSLRRKFQFLGGGSKPEVAIPHIQ